MTSVQPAESGKRAAPRQKALLDVVTLAFLCGALVALWVLIFQGGWDYYRTPLSNRGYEKAHRLLRPSGLTGHALGIAGTLCLFSTLPYVARKRLKRLAKSGSLSNWLEFHIFCGIFGPVLVTLHTAFKFNGIISVAFWSMLLVVLSGFIGRYLYVRIPKSLRGEELTHAEAVDLARELRERLLDTGLPSALVAEIEALEEAIVPVAGPWSPLRTMSARIALRRRTAELRREVQHAGMERHLVHQVLDLAHERAVLLRRIARLKKTRQLFQLWHVFHRPLVWVMFLVFFIHLGVAIYFGYTYFGGAQ